VSGFHDIRHSRSCAADITPAARCTCGLAALKADAARWREWDTPETEAAVRRATSDAARWRWLEAHCAGGVVVLARLLQMNHSEEYGYECGVYHDDEKDDRYGKGPTLADAVDAAMAEGA
jgi:hypothetical protein